MKSNKFCHVSTNSLTCISSQVTLTAINFRIFRQLQYMVLSYSEVSGPCPIMFLAGIRRCRAAPVPALAPVPAPLDGQSEIASHQKGKHRGAALTTTCPIIGIGAPVQNHDRQQNIRGVKQSGWPRFDKKLALCQCCRSSSWRYTLAL